MDLFYVSSLFTLNTLRRKNSFDPIHLCRGQKRFPRFLGFASCLVKSYANLTQHQAIIDSPLPSSYSKPQKSRVKSLKEVKTLQHRLNVCQLRRKRLRVVSVGQFFYCRSYRGRSHCMQVGTRTHRELKRGVPSPYHNTAIRTPPNSDTAFTYLYNQSRLLKLHSWRLAVIPRLTFLFPG